MKKIKYENEHKLYDEINEYIKDKNFDILLISTPKIMKKVLNDKLINTNKNIFRILLVFFILFPLKYCQSFSITPSYK